jgi:hypothetical protein
MNGSGLGVAAVGVNPFDDVSDIELYDFASPFEPIQFITRITTPGNAQTVSIYNGRAYAADGANGLQVINYLGYDTGTNPPAITLSTSFALSTPTNGVAEEGKLVRVTARVTDDVQVRNVEFYVDGVRVLTDGNFPFEHRFVTPRMTASKATFIVRARATDTGGNFAWSDALWVSLSADETPPRVTLTEPLAYTVVTPLNAPRVVLVYFNEPMDAGSLQSGQFRIEFAGNDYHFGSPDDQILTNATLSYDDTLNLAVIQFPSELAQGVYRGVLTPEVRDAAGVHLAGRYSWRFAVLPGGPGADEDFDAMSNVEELRFGSNPFLDDSDGDGWSDLDEYQAGTDPNEPGTRPRPLFVARPLVQVSIPSLETEGVAGLPVFLARPPLQIDLVSPDTFGLASSGITLGRPGVSIEVPSVESFGVGGVAITMALPPVSIDLPSSNTHGGLATGMTLAKPNLIIEAASADVFGGSGNGMRLGRPPVSLLITTNNQAIGP